MVTLGAEALSHLYGEDAFSWAVVNSETGELIGLKDSRQTAITAAGYHYRAKGTPAVAIKLRLQPVEVVPTG
jgi:hypothetical protein